MHCAPPCKISASPDTSCGNESKTVQTAQFEKKLFGNKSFGNSQLDNSGKGKVFMYQIHKLIQSGSISIVQTKYLEKIR